MTNQVFEVSVEGREEKISLNQTQINSINDSLTSTGKYHILENGKGYTVEVMEANAEEKTITLRLNGKVAHLKLKDKTDLLLEKMGLNSTAKKKAAQLKAPMPGLVKQVMVAVGDVVAKGSPLLVLEAMKMENVLKAEADGTVKSISVEAGSKTEKGQLLIEFS